MVFARRVRGMRTRFWLRSPAGLQSHSGPCPSRLDLGCLVRSGFSDEETRSAVTFSEFQLGKPVRPGEAGGCVCHPGCPGCPGFPAQVVVVEVQLLRATWTVLEL